MGLRPTEEGFSAWCFSNLRPTSYDCGAADSAFGGTISLTRVPIDPAIGAAQRLRVAISAVHTDCVSLPERASWSSRYPALEDDTVYHLR
jgi:hypothetical protein